MRPNSRLSLRPVLTFSLSTLFVLAVFSQAVLAAEPQVPEKVKTLLQDRKYAEAVKAIDEAAGQKEVSQDYLRYLKARALHLDQKYDDAIAVYASLEKDFPKSDWVRRARFGRAISLTRKGDFKAAEVIYRDEADYLLSADRKQEIAGIYLEFADSYFKPKDEHQAPDYQKALEFYQKALEVGPKPDKRAESNCWSRAAISRWATSRRRPIAIRSSSRTTRTATWTSKPASAWAKRSWRWANRKKPAAPGKTCWRCIPTPRATALPKPRSTCR